MVRHSAIAPNHQPAHTLDARCYIYLGILYEVVVPFPLFPWSYLTLPPPNPPPPSCLVLLLFPSTWQVDGMPLAEFLELSSLAMTDPMSGAALVPGGEDVDLTIDNVGEFVESVTTRWVMLCVTRSDVDTHASESYCVKNETREEMPERDEDDRCVW